MSTQNIGSLGKILGVWAHPDDEVFCMGGIMAAAAANGQSVACITATRGEAGVQDESRWPARQLGAIRTQELADAYKALGVNEHHWLDYPDGGCAQVSAADATEQISELIKKFQPDSILTFGPDGMTGHPDHQTVSAWASQARDKAGSSATIYHSIQIRQNYEAAADIDKALNIFFNIDTPRMCEPDEADLYFLLNDELFAKKFEALRVMPSQTERLITEFGDQLRPAFGVEAFVRI